MLNRTCWDACLGALSAACSLNSTPCEPGAVADWTNGPVTWRFFVNASQRVGGARHKEEVSGPLVGAYVCSAYRPHVGAVYDRCARCGPLGVESVLLLLLFCVVLLLSITLQVRACATRHPDSVRIRVGVPECYVCILGYMIVCVRVICVEAFTAAIVCAPVLCVGAFTATIVCVPVICVGAFTAAMLTYV